MTTHITERDLTSEAFREICLGNGTVYRIDRPVRLWHRIGASTVRILDAGGMVHLVPEPGHYGAIHRWEPKDPNAPPQF